jgi:hypothetical protein
MSQPLKKGVERVREVEEYCRPRHIEMFEISDLYDLPHDWPANREFPNSKTPGCYAFYDEAGELLYIGKASRTMGERIASYFRWNRDQKRLETVDRGWTREPRYVQTIAVWHPEQAQASRACHRLNQSSVAARARTPMKEQAVFS